MFRINPPPRAQHRAWSLQTGAAAVEFALVVVVFLTLIFSVIEMARLVYLFNTLQEVTRNAARAASGTNFRDEAAKSLVRQNAIFRTSAGTLVLGDPVTADHIRIDYLSVARNPDGSMQLTPIPEGALASCPARNRLICTADPHNASCIRFVRVRVCEPGGVGICDPVEYVPLMPLLRVSALKLPMSTTIVKAETLGYESGQSMCP